MIKNTYNLKIRHILYAGISLVALSFLGYFYDWINIAGFAAFSLFCLILGLYKREFAIYLAFLELTLGSFGYLLSFGGLSLRMAFFIIIMGLWIYDLITNYELRITNYRKSRQTLVFLASFLIIWMFGIIQGYLRGHNAADIFFDANSYFYLLLFLPALSYIDTEKKILGLAKTILFGAGVLAVLTLALFIIFTVSQNAEPLSVLYKWIRDLRLGELTPQEGGFYRIFFQSQIYFLPAFFLVIARDWHKKISRASFAVWGGLLSAAIYASLSRSFWVGTAAGLAALAIFAFLKFNYKIALKKYAELAAVIIIGILAVNLFIPSDASMFANRLKVGEEAIDTRIAELAPLFLAIKTNPVFGYGFGKALTFKSFDPRVGGRDFTAYAFEWGYLDMILKFGLLGLAAYLYFIWTIIRKLFQKFKVYPLYCLWAFASLAAVLAIHIFTPYLNHPLGIGIIVLAGIISNIRE